ncbi:hypothetical protein, partial [Photobacterium damselae]|uniref:hypothetical protein n=1 Tax=Photobacterium damselae TaxID=38293 RepID=UPI002F3FC910
LMHVNKLRVYPAYKDNFNKSMKLLARRGVIELDKNINTSRISARLTNQGLALAREIYAQLSGEQIMNEGNYPCGVNNCGDGHCVHQWYPARCPECGSQMVLVATSKFMFCSNRKDGKCEFECFEDEFKDRCALINTN